MTESDLQPTAIEESASPLIHIDGLHKSYELDGKEIQVLKGIDLEIRHGQRLSIVGKSGVGKSTFLHVLGTLDRPSSGMIRFEGRDVFSYSDRKLAQYRNRSIGFVFQFHYLLPDFNALENVSIPMRIAKLDPTEVDRRAKELLELVGLQDRATHKPGELSGGEQQRVAIARALVMRPSVILADEPTGNLDDQTSQGIHDLLCNLNETYRTTLVVVTHNRSLADRMDEKLELVDGQIYTRQDSGKA